MDTVNCHLEMPQVDGLPDNVMTVGRHLILNCQGEWDKTFDFTRANVKLAENQKYLIKVLKAEARSISSFDVEFTLYSAGQIKLPSFILTDGTHEITLGAQQFQVGTMIEKTEDGKPPQPFGPILPLKLVWPPIYLFLSLILILSAITFFVLKLRRRARYKRLIEGLKQYDSTLEPDLQFYKSMRGLEKMQYPLADLENAFRVYALRVFQVPFFDLNPAQSVRFMKKRRPEFKKQRTQVQKFLDEFEELAKRTETVSSLERAELAKKLYRFVDTQEDLRNKAGAR